MSNPTRTQILVFTIVAIIYLLTLTSDYYWDGITFALQIEKVASHEWDLSLLFHQNHLLYSAVGYLFYRAVLAFGFATRALYLLQITNGILGALAVGVFYRIAERVLRNNYLAIVCAVGFAMSAAWWKLATDTDAYIPSILLMLLCINNLLSEKPRWFVAGLALAGAMLFHQLASLIYPAIVIAVFRNTDLENKGRFVTRLSLTAWLPCIAVYYACAALLHGIKQPLDVLKWATSNPSEVTPSLNPVAGLGLIPRTTLDSLVGHRFRLFVTDTRAIEWLLAIAACVAVVLLLITLARKVSFGNIYKSIRTTTPAMSVALRMTVPTLTVWIGTYMMFLVFWEPWQVYYRTFYTPALVLLAGFALANYHAVTRAAPSRAAALAVAVVALLNLALYIGPLRRANSNELIATARGANRIWNETTVVYYAGRTEADTTFQYFNEHTQWRRLTSGLDLDSEIDDISRAGGSIWLNKGAADAVGSSWLARHVRREVIELRTANARYVEVSAKP